MGKIIKKLSKLIRNKYSLFILIAVFTVPVFLNLILFQFSTPITYQGDWLSFWGNYSGGILSAIVAYIVANVQIKKQIEKENYNKKVSQLPALIKLDLLLKEIIEETKRIKEEQEQSTGKKKENPEECYYPMNRINEKSMQLINLVENIELHVDLITCFNFYQRLSEAFSYNVYLSEDRIIKLNNEELLKGRRNFPTRLLHERVQLAKEIDKYSRLKRQCWDKLFKQNMIEVMEQTLKQLNDEINDINNLKKKGNSMHSNN